MQLIRDAHTILHSNTKHHTVGAILEAVIFTQFLELKYKFGTLPVNINLQNKQNVCIISQVNSISQKYYDDESVTTQQINKSSERQIAVFLRITF